MPPFLPMFLAIRRRKLSKTDATCLRDSSVLSEMLVRISLLPHPTPSHLYQLGQRDAPINRADLWHRVYRMTRWPASVSCTPLFDLTLHMPHWSRPVLTAIAALETPEVVMVDVAITVQVRGKNPGLIGHERALRRHRSGRIRYAGAGAAIPEQLEVGFIDTAIRVEIGRRDRRRCQQGKPRADDLAASQTIASAGADEPSNRPPPWRVDRAMW